MSMIGKKVWCEGTVGAYDINLDKKCIVDITGDYNSSHEWVNCNNATRALPQGTKISFTAIVYQYTGLQNEVVVTKIGLTKLRNIKELS